jgi:spore maturation protein CgeB
MPVALRIAIIDKGGGLLTWHLDLAEGFRRCGALVLPLYLRASTWAEFVAKRRSGASHEANPSTQIRIAHELSAFQPNLIIVLNLTGLPGAAVQLWRDAIPRGTAIVGWLCDRGDSLPPGYSPGFDGLYYFDTSDRAGLAAEYASTAARLAHLPLAVNPDRFPLCTTPTAARRPVLVFAGNCTAQRREAIARLQAAGEPVESYGPNSGHRFRFWRNRRYSQSHLARLYGSHLACLNLLQSGNTHNGLNLRAFEIPCAGGLGTYPDVPDLPACFEPGREILVYHRLEELPEIMARLRREPGTADAMIAASRKRALSEHTYVHRAARMLHDFAS